MGSHSLLQGIFLIEGSNLGVLHCRQIHYCLSHQGNLKYSETEVKLGIGGQSLYCVRGLRGLSLQSPCPGLMEEAGCRSPSLFQTHQGYRFNNRRRHGQLPTGPSGSPTRQGSPLPQRGCSSRRIPGGQHPLSTLSCAPGSSTLPGHSH